MVQKRLITSALALSLSGLAQTHTPLADPIPQLMPDSNIQVGLQSIASGFVAPTWVAYAPGDKKHLYLADQPGKLYEITLPDNDGDGHHSSNTPVAPRLLLDISDSSNATDKVVKVGLFGIGYDERGFLSLVFHPRFQHNGLLYTFTSEVTDGRPDFTTLSPGVAPNCQTVIREWHVMDSGNDERRGGLSLDPMSRVILRIDKPQFNHNGGTLAFGPDGMLYISLGDGGNANDEGPGHVAGGNAQSLATTNILGKILRIDPLGHDSANGQYGIPRDNPFAHSNAGPAEVWAYGFRNPFRFSFDSKSGKLMAGDVGQNNIEEVDVVKKGDNYGWPIKEGTFLFNDGSGRAVPNTTGYVYANSPGTPIGLVDPIAEYDHADAPLLNTPVRVAVVGGYTYRGDSVSDLEGHYLFGDYSAAIGSAANGHLFTLEGGALKNVGVVGHSPNLGLAVLSFGQDEDGELYLLANSTGTVNGQTGQLFKIVSAHPDDRHHGGHDRGDDDDRNH